MDCCAVLPWYTVIHVAMRTPTGGKAKAPIVSSRCSTVGSPACMGIYLCEPTDTCSSARDEMPADIRDIELWSMVFMLYKIFIASAQRVQHQQMPFRTERHV